MEWTDEGIVLGVRRHGEASAILDVLTAEHGRHLGLVRGGAGSRLRAVLQLGNTLRVTWRARLDEHLGHYAVEALALRSASFLSLPYALYGLTHLCALARLLPERDPHPALHAALDVIVDALADPGNAAAGIARFELQLLAELGFGLDLEECAATGARGNLIYVSPKSGRAVSREAGAAWRDKLLPLPAFLASDVDTPRISPAELMDGFALTGFFLLRHVLEPRGSALPDARAQFLLAVTRALADDRPLA
ncbi:MAG TPA: DNA repair protein RecO [Xanthobacteraceae bacterium]|nr:DNA repair protein RecO [Xanthobacteraceae bacterium]